jgi:hypothetical protein
MEARREEAMRTRAVDVEEEAGTWPGTWGRGRSSTNGAKGEGGGRGVEGKLAAGSWGEVRGERAKTERGARAGAEARM